MVELKPVLRDHHGLRTVHKKAQQTVMQYMEGGARSRRGVALVESTLMREGGGREAWGQSAGCLSLVRGDPPIMSPVLSGL